MAATPSASNSPVPYPVSERLYALAKDSPRWTRAAQAKLNEFVRSQDAVSLSSAGLPGPVLNNPRALEAFLRAGVSCSRVYWPLMPEQHDVRREALSVDAPLEAHAHLDAAGVPGILAEKVRDRTAECIRALHPHSVMYLVAHHASATSVLLATETLENLGAIWLDRFHAKKDMDALSSIVRQASRLGANWETVSKRYSGQAWYPALEAEMLSGSLSSTTAARPSRARM